MLYLPFLAAIFVSKETELVYSSLDLEFSYFNIFHTSKSEKCHIHRQIREVSIVPPEFGMKIIVLFACDFF